MTTLANRRSLIRLSPARIKLLASAIAILGAATAIYAQTQPASILGPESDLVLTILCGLVGCIAGLVVLVYRSVIERIERLEGLVLGLKRANRV
jgi:hypothetical protein